MIVKAKQPFGHDVQVQTGLKLSGGEVSADSMRALTLQFGNRQTVMTIELTLEECVEIANLTGIIMAPPPAEPSLTLNEETWEPQPEAGPWMADGVPTRDMWEIATRRAMKMPDASGRISDVMAQNQIAYGILEYTQQERPRDKADDFLIHLKMVQDEAQRRVSKDYEFLGVNGGRDSVLLLSRRLRVVDGALGPVQFQSMDRDELYNLLHGNIDPRDTKQEEPLRELQRLDDMIEDEGTAANYNPADLLKLDAEAFLGHSRKPTEPDARRGSIVRPKPITVDRMKLKIMMRDILRKFDGATIEGDRIDSIAYELSQVIIPMQEDPDGP